MNTIALKMLTGDRGKYLGIVIGLTFASLLITQQLGIFLGLMSRTFGFISDSGYPDVWVMDPKVQQVDDVKPLQDTQLLRVRGVPGVAWAVPLYKGLLKARLDNGNFQQCNVVGLDDATLIGGPPTMLVGRLEDLRRSEAVIVDDVGARDKLGHALPDGTKVPLKVGDTLELNDHRAVVVGICRVTQTFQSQPVVYTTYQRATRFAPRERKLLSFILAGARPGVSPDALTKRIKADTGMAAYTQQGFKDLTLWYFMRETGIPINFGISVILGFIVGTAIAGQTLYNFTLENAKQFAALKAMGTGNWVLLRMVLLQSALVGVLGYGLGVGAAALFGYATSGGALAFYLPWQLLVFAAASVTIICGIASLISLRTVLTLEPGIVFKG